jgi:hypothetical protein
MDGARSAARTIQVNVLFVFFSNLTVKFIIEQNQNNIYFVLFFKE